LSEISESKRTIYTEDGVIAKLKQDWDIAEKVLADAQAVVDKFKNAYYKREAKLLSLPCPMSPNKKHMFHGFCEANGHCEHCGLDGGID